jgi:hypothetical protein
VSLDLQKVIYISSYLFILKQFLFDLPFGLEYICASMKRYRISLFFLALFFFSNGQTISELHYSLDDLVFVTSGKFNPLSSASNVVRY